MPDSEPIKVNHGTPCRYSQIVIGDLDATTKTKVDPNFDIASISGINIIFANLEINFDGYFYCIGSFYNCTITSRGFWETIHFSEQSNIINCIFDCDKSAWSNNKILISFEEFKIYGCTLRDVVFLNANYARSILIAKSIVNNAVLPIFENSVISHSTFNNAERFEGKYIYGSVINLKKGVSAEIDMALINSTVTGSYDHISIEMYTFAWAVCCFPVTSTGKEVIISNVTINGSVIVNRNGGNFGLVGALIRAYYPKYSISNLTCNLQV